MKAITERRRRRRKKPAEQLDLIDLINRDRLENQMSEPATRSYVEKYRAKDPASTRRPPPPKGTR